MNNRYAVIENGIVVNVIVADADYAFQNNLVTCDSAGPGWSYVNGEFTAPQQQVIPETPAPTKEELLAQIQAIQQQVQDLQ